MKIFALALALCFPLYCTFAQSVAVGSMGGSFAVNEMGAATYTIPIDVPQGINGMQPNVALTYNSQSGNGVCGLGFSITGLSTITRIPRTIYYDGTAKGIKYDATDAYALNGQRLLLVSGTEGKDGAKYGLEGDMQTEVILHGSGTNQWWEVKSGGVTMKLGNANNARNIVDNTTIWYINEANDIHNNVITYTYSKSSNYCYLQAISYGASQIKFSYESRSDKLKFKVREQDCLIKERLNWVYVYESGVLLYKYQLNYSSVGTFSALSSVTKLNAQGETMPNINLAWNGIKSSYTCETTTVPNNASEWIEKGTVPTLSQKFIAGDFDGDGLCDVLAIADHDKVKQTYDLEYVRNGTVMCLYKSKRVGKKIEFVPMKEFTSISYYKTSGRDVTAINIRTGALVGDFTGDGKCDFVCPRYFVYGVNNSEKQLVFDFCNTDNDTEVPYRQMYSLNMSIKDDNNDINKYFPLFCNSDFNNDGKSDIFYIERIANGKGQYMARILSYKDNGSSMFLELSNKPEYIFAADFNGDGLSDIMLVSDKGYDIFWNNGAGLSSSTFTNNNKTKGANISAKDPLNASINITAKDTRVLQIGDFNGDGLPDVVINKNEDSQWKILFNHGNGRFRNAITYDGLLYKYLYDGKNKDHFDCKILDFDHDGKDDIVLIESAYKEVVPRKRNLISHIYWLKSDGVSKFTEVRHVITPNPDDALFGLCTIGDFDGDGYVDLLNYGNNIYESTSNNVNTTKWNLYRSDNNPSSGKIYDINEQCGLQLNISYASLSDPTTYQKAKSNISNLLNITIPLSVVSKTNAVIGSARTEKTQTGIYDVATRQIVNYSYSNLKYNVAGRGILGFETTSQSFNDITKTVHIDAWNTQYMLPTAMTETTQFGTLTQSIKHENTIFGKGGKRYLLSKQKSMHTDIYGNKTITDNTYNTTYGYLENTKTTYSDGSYKQQVHSLYKQINRQWYPQQILAIQKHSDDANTFQSKTKLSYNTTTGDITSKIENADTKSALTYSYTYDAFGNVTSQQISGNGVAAQSSKYNYDGSHRFVTQESNSSGINITYSYDKWGHVISETDKSDSQSPLKTTYEYDAWGRLIKQTSPEGIATTITYTFDSNHDKCFCIKTKTEGQPSSEVWYDNAGNEVVRITQGALGLRCCTTTKYDNRCRAIKVTTSRGKLTLSLSNTYDALDRIITSVQSNGITKKYTYSNRQIRVFDGATTQTTTYDAWGNPRTTNDGVATTTYTYTSCSKPSKIVTAGATFSMTYDEIGNQLTLSDPNAGTTRYEYDALGRITKQTDARGTVTTYTYNARGLITEKKCGEWSYMYIYNNRNLLTHEQNGDCITKYTYDKYCRISGKNINTFGHVMNTSYTYDMYGRLQTTTYPDGTKVNNIYDSSGNVVGQDVNGTRLWNIVVDNGISRKSIMPRGSIDTKIGADGRLQSKAYTIGPVEKYSFSYTYNNNTGNITSKTTDFAGVKSIENYTYDTSDRLLSASSSKNNLQMTYAPNGNILSKTDMGKYTYNNYKPHAVAKVENSSKLISHETQEIIYAPFNKVERINETVDGKELNLIITYGPDDQRVSTELSVDWETIEMRYYMGNFEQVIDKNGKQTNLLYITSPDGLTHIIANGQIYYALTDHLGSVVRLYKNSMDLEFATTYDVWGASTTTINKTPWLRRGFTMHEHWPEFGLIDMNGRFYDPQLGRFLSPDPYVQAPDNPQNFNRYSYCLNNPLKYTDPSGEIFTEIFTICAMAYMGGIMSNAMTAENPFNCATWNWRSVSTYTGIASGALSGAGMAGYSFTIFPKVDGMLTRGAMMGSMNFVLNGIGNLAQDKCFDNNWKGAVLSGFVNGAIEGYYLAEANGTNLWWGNEIKYNRTKWSFFTYEQPYETIKWDIKDASKYANDCVVSTIVEANNYLGGDATYEQVAKDVGYEQGVGTKSNLAMYENNLRRHVNGYSIRTDNINDLNLVKQYKEQGSVINVNMPHKVTPRHADNIRSISFYKSGKVIVRLRIGSYNANTINDNWHFYLLHSIK